MAAYDSFKPVQSPVHLDINWLDGKSQPRQAAFQRIKTGDSCFLSVSLTNKAIEELVSNSFDAGAENVHVLLSADLGSDDSTIVVIDDGEGMDESGLRNHWIIGESGKRKKGLVLPKGRKQIGKFQP